MAIAPVLKTGTPSGVRGFESHLLRPIAQLKKMEESHNGIAKDCEPLPLRGPVGSSPTSSADCPHSSMDRIQDCGSWDRSSNLLGGTLRANVSRKTVH